MHKHKNKFWENTKLIIKNQSKKRLIPETVCRLVALNAGSEKTSAGCHGGSLSLLERHL